MTYSGPALTCFTRTTFINILSNAITSETNIGNWCLGKVIILFLQSRSLFAYFARRDIMFESI